MLVVTLISLNDFVEYEAALVDVEIADILSSAGFWPVGFATLTQSLHRLRKGKILGGGN